MFCAGNVVAARVPASSRDKNQDVKGVKPKFQSKFDPG